MIGYYILGAVGLFLAIILLRAAFFRPKAQPQPDGRPFPLTGKAPHGHCRS